VKVQEASKAQIRWQEDGKNVLRELTMTRWWQKANVREEWESAINDSEVITGTAV
jgi:hypothetical protein